MAGNVVLIDTLERFRRARHATAIVFLGLLDTVFISSWLQLEFANWFAQALQYASGCTCFAVLLFLFVQLALLTSELLLFTQRSLARTGNFACRRQTRLREALLRRQVVVFYKRLVIGVVELVEEPVSDKANLTLGNLCSDWLKLRWLFHDVAGGSDVADMVSDRALCLDGCAYLLSCRA